MPETIESVLSQEEEGITVAYYVLDGGSSDGSLEIIKAYSTRLAYWRSARDEGQASAIAEGLAMGRGDIVAWINSDDMYPQGTFRKVAQYFSAHPDVDLIYGDCMMINESSCPIGLGTHIQLTWKELYETPYLINQEAVFLRRSLYERAGGVDPGYWGAMDYHLWLKTFYAGSPRYLPETLGIHRMLPDQKSATSERYIKEMQKARAVFGQSHALKTSEWPYSSAARLELLASWEKEWKPILDWVEQGCPEGEFHGAIEERWKRYAQEGVLSVRGGTSFGWVGPDALYVIDCEIAGRQLQWHFASPLPALSASRLTLELDGRVHEIVLDGKSLQCFDLRSPNKYLPVRIHADRSYVPALVNSGPAYFFISFVSQPKPKGKQILSVQSIPCLPRPDELSANTNSELRKDSVMLQKYHSRPATNKCLRVAFLTSHPASVGSGSERLIYNTANALIARGHDARVYVMNESLDPSPPFFVHQLPVLPFERVIETAFRKVTGWNDLFFPSTGFLRARNWLRRADIWHIHNIHGHYMSIPLLGLLSWTQKIVISPVDQYLSTGQCPYTMGCERFLSGCGSCPRMDEPWPGISRDATSLLWQLKRLFFLCSRVRMLYHTRSLAEHYGQTFVRRRPGKVIHYGVDICCFRKLPRRTCEEMLGVGHSNRFVVGLFHSHLTDRRKGIFPLIQRLGELARAIPGKIALLVVGHGSDAARALIPADLELVALPFLREPFELANALNLCDVLLYPTQAENLSLTTLCALACAVPVISYDVGGQGEAVKNGINGFLVPVHDQEAMCKALHEMVESPMLTSRLADGARRTAEEEFDFERYIDEIMYFYNSD